jgi:hypothetical protein
MRPAKVPVKVTIGAAGRPDGVMIAELVQAAGGLWLEQGGQDVVLLVMTEPAG